VQGFVPRRFWMGERETIAAVMADFVVVPAHRSLGPALKLMRTGIELGKARFSFSYGTPNEKSLAIVRRAGLETIGVFTRYTKVLRSESYWRRRIPSWLTPVAAALVDLGILAVDLGRGWLRGNPFHWAERVDFGVEFDRIWQMRSVHRVYGDRSCGTLAWRYPAGSGQGAWRISLASSAGGDVLGYVVWRLRNGTVMVNDFLVVESGASQRTFLHSFSQYVRRFAVDRVSVEFYGASDVVEALRDCGFAPREQSSIVRASQQGGDVSLSQASAYMTSFDRDNDE